MFNNGLCPTCLHGLGGRSEAQLVIRSAWSYPDAGWVRGPMRNQIRLYSERFLSLLTTDERQMLTFRPVRICAKTRIAYFELGGEPSVDFVAVKHFDFDGFQCPTCARYRWLSLQEPALERSRNPITDFVCREHLPHASGSCFAVDSRRAPTLCMTRQRWDQIRGHKYAKGLDAKLLGVVPEQECNFNLRLRTRQGPCDRCSSWPEPVTLHGKMRRVWNVPACDLTADSYSMRNLQWLAPAAAANVIQITRQTIPIPELEALISSGKRPRTVQYISFRCPECWRIGRVSLDDRELALCW